MSYTRKNILAFTPATTRGQPVQLGTDSKGENLLYTNGKTVIIRSLAHPENSKEYTQHSANATVAKYAPSGYYIASGDVNGTVRIWDTVGEEQILKTEVKVISGKITDIAWDSESKRIIAVGDGREKYGHAFLFDSGSSVGEIAGHHKVINSVSIRQQRPFRAATASDDFSVVFYHGVPYKYNKAIKDHTGFVQGVSFSPDGEKFVSVGSDKKVFLYDGKTGDKLSELSAAAGSDTHTGSVYAVSWSPDSKKILTSSGDKTAKIWDVEAQKIVRTFEFSNNVDDQQVGNVWRGSYLISLSLSGNINYLDEASPKPVRIVKGHQKAITALTKTDEKTLFTGNEGHATELDGQGHSNQVTQLVNHKNAIYSVGMDDSLREIDPDNKSFSALVLPTKHMPKGLGVGSSGVSVIGTVESLLLIKDKKEVFNTSVQSPPGAVAIKADETEVAVGGEDSKIRLYSLKDDRLTETKQLDANRGAITALSYSPDGSLLAAGDAQGKIMVYDTVTGSVKLSQWVFHTARINSIAWSSDGKHAVSGSLDTNIYIWSTEKPMKKIQIKGAHQVGVTGVIFMNDNTVASVGQDACVKIWNIQHH
ncbi:11111_t:CDS:10 [Paraglomus occultum]|uniref:11111_t:CDS:1 n=1 Tax=Paraglomus occultum TaxID=144539 RepID=A0A9N9A8G7_9GLOM|nr:11111_t:CDS:10 [Paraglomus occultum]